MVNCPQCEAPELASSRARLGTPAYPVRCKQCGSEFHGSFFWWAIPVTAILTVSALVGAMVLGTIWRSPAAVILPFGIALALGLLAAHKLSKRQAPVRTRLGIKRITRLVALALLAYCVVQFMYDMLAA